MKTGALVSNQKKTCNQTPDMQQNQFSVCDTWECGGRGRRRHGDGNSHAAAATVLPAAAPTAAAGMAAPTATTAHAHKHTIRVEQVRTDPVFQRGNG